MNQKAYYENYWRHRLKHESDLTKAIPARIKLTLKHLPPPPAAILDLGCGEGSLGKAAKRLSARFRLIGADISPIALKLARPRYDRVLCLDLDSPGRFTERFDAVTALEIIEHLDHPGRLLKFIFGRLQPAGRLILSFPNTRWWGIKNERPTYTDADHRQQFSLASITNLLKRHGFWVEQIDGIFTLQWRFGRLPDRLQKWLGQVNPGRFGYQLILVCRKRSRRPVVAHLVKDYLNASESWIYTQIRSARQFSPLVLSRSWKNLDQFPSSGLIKYPLFTDNLPASLIRKILALLQKVKDRFSPAETNFYRRILAQSGASLIHAHYGPTAYEAIGLSRTTRLPLVVSFYGGDAYWLPTNFPVWKKRYLRLWRQARAIIVKGPKMRQRLIQLGCPAAKIFIIDHGVDLRQIRFQVRRPAKRVKLLTACTLIDYKGVDLVIQAIKNLARVSLTVAGDGPEAGRLHALVKNLKLGRRVKFAGWVSWAKLINLAGKHHIFIHPSFRSADNKQEGIPTSIIERVASGMPVIATRHADIPEIVKNGRNGYLVPEKDVAALAQRIGFLARHPQLWQKFGRFGRRLVEKSFDAAKQNRIRERLYTFLTSGNGADKYDRAGHAASQPGRRP